MEEAITERYPPAQCTKKSPSEGKDDKWSFNASKGAVSADNKCSERYSGVFLTSNTSWLFFSTLSMASAAEME